MPQRNVANNGNVSVIPRDRPKRRRAQWEEQLHRGIRYQVPEDTLILDFWAKVRDPDRKYVSVLRAHSPLSRPLCPIADGPLRPQPFDRIMNQRRLARQLGEHEDGEASDSSDLTSLDSSDSESEQPNRAAKQSNAKTKAPAPLTLTREAQGTASASTPGPAAAAAAAAAARMVKPQHSPLPVDEHNVGPQRLNCLSSCTRLLTTIALLSRLLELPLLLALRAMCNQHLCPQPAWRPCL